MCKLRRLWRDCGGVGEREIMINEVVCPDCGGDGKPKIIKCGTCDGSGLVDSGGFTPCGNPIEVSCPDCKDGWPKFIPPCATCRGVGWILVDELTE